MKEKKKICWLSAGVSSFIAGYLERDTIDEYIYMDIDDQHEDSMRFMKDCEKALGKPITILKSEYGSVENVIRTAGMIKNPRTQFAPCTNWLKKRIRKEWELMHPDWELTYVWGMDYDEKDRAEKLCEANPDYTHEFPLIDKMLTKQDAHAILDRLGIQRPKMYDLGYHNNNCIGCIKGGMGYWNKIRVDFPEIFEKRAKLERDIGASILKDCYLDELDPHRGRIEDEISQDCGVLCYLNL